MVELNSEFESMNQNLEWWRVYDKILSIDQLGPDQINQAWHL